MPAVYTDAPEVSEIADDLITARHKHLARLGVRIEFLFADTPLLVGGKRRPAASRKLSGLHAYLARFNGEPEYNTEGAPLFVLTVHEDAYREMTEADRIALVDSELSRFGAQMVTVRRQGEEVQELRLFFVPHVPETAFSG